MSREDNGSMLLLGEPKGFSGLLSLVYPFGSRDSWFRFAVADSS